MKKIILINSSGEIVSLINTNDPTIHFEEKYTAIDITENPIANNIEKNMHYYKVKNNKLLEKNEQEKAMHREKIKFPVSSVDILQREIDLIKVELAKLQTKIK